MKDKELKQLALDIYQRRVFTSNMIDKRDLSMLGMIFLPLLMGVSKKELEGVCMLYEYYDKALPRAVNGYPCFRSVWYLREEDTKKLDKIYKKIVANVEKAIGSERQRE